MRKPILATVAAVALAALVGSCAAPPTEVAAPPTNANNAAFKACMVSDSGGFDDKSFNQTAYKGLTDAVAKLGISEGKVESKSDADYPTNLNAMLQAKCNIIFGIGFKLSSAMVTAAKANPQVKFALVDDNPKDAAGITNLKPLVYNTAQSAFLGGYLAASMTKTGKIGTFGGDKFGTVTIFMDGFAQGAAYYNKTKSKNVQVLGWNTETQQGTFVPPPSPFENLAGGKQAAQTLVSQGADILHPVAGPAGVGALQVAKESGGKVNAVWVDTDGCQSAAEYCSVILSSVYKGMDVSVTNTIEAAVKNTFTSEPYRGTLENQGTGLSPYNQWDAKIPAEVKAEIDKLKADIIAGTIKIESKAQPS